MMSTRSLLRILTVGLGVSALLNVPRPAAGDDALYQKQMAVYQKLNAEYRQRQEALRRLRETMDQREASRRQMEPKLRKLAEKIAGYQNKLSENELKISQYEQDIKDSEAEAISQHIDYWRDQRGYAVYQGDYGRLSRDQMNARTQIKKYLAQNESLAKKIKAVQDKHYLLLDEDRVLAKQIADLHKEVDLVSAPLTQGPAGR